MLVVLFIAVGTCLPLISRRGWWFTVVSGLTWLVWWLWASGGFVVIWMFTMDFRFGFSFCGMWVCVYCVLSGFGFM